MRGQSMRHTHNVIARVHLFLRRFAIKGKLFIVKETLRCHKADVSCCEQRVVVYNRIEIFIFNNIFLKDFQLNVFTLTLIFLLFDVGLNRLN